MIPTQWYGLNLLKAWRTEYLKLSEFGRMMACDSEACVANPNDSHAAPSEKAGKAALDDQ